MSLVRITAAFGCGSALTALLLSPFSTSDLASHPLWQRFSLRPLESKSAASGSWRETVKALKLNGAEAAELMSAGGEMALLVLADHHVVINSYIAPLVGWGSALTTISLFCLWRFDSQKWIRRAAASISLPIGLFAVLVGMGLRQLKLGEI